MSRTQKKVVYGIVFFVLIGLVVTMMIIFGMNPRTVQIDGAGVAQVINL